MTDPRLTTILSDRWISFPRAETVLARLAALMSAPRRTRMPGLLVHGASGIGKTMIAQKMKRDHPPVFHQPRGFTETPLLLIQAPPAPDERRLYLHILSAIGAPIAGSHTLAELEVRVMRFLEDLKLRMIIIDEVHNLLAGTHREQRRFLNVLRFLSNELHVSLVCFGVSEAVDAIRGDVQLARRLDEHHLPNWTDDLEFSELVRTLVAAMPLGKSSQLSIKSLRRVLNVTDGVTALVVAMIRDLAVRAIEKGTEAITDAAVEEWRPTWSIATSAERPAA